MNWGNGTRLSSKKWKQAARQQKIFLSIAILACTLGLIIQNVAMASDERSAKIGLTAQISTRMSLIHVGSNDSFKPTSKGVEAGRLLLDALEKDDLKAAKSAIELYDEIVPRENYGGEYTALKWFAEIITSSEAEKQELIKDPFIKEFHNFFSTKEYANLKEYLKRKYKLRSLGDEESMEGQRRLAYLEDTILFNNPRREDWENTSDFLKIMALPEGTVVADIGSGPGYYSTKMAKLVGKNGKVFSIDTVEEHLDYIRRLKKIMKLKNITPILTDGKTLGIPGIKVDAVVMCSLYHNIYGMSTLPDREQFLQSILKALKDDGKLYIFDNGLVPHGTLPYHGPYVAQELVIGQLSQYGFKLVSKHQPVAQRYALVFEKTTSTHSNKTTQKSHD